jgi:hypothetical protein
VVERYRDLGGERIVAGSDAHRIESFGFGLGKAYRSIVASGFSRLSFRRGGDRLSVDLSVEAMARAANEDRPEARFGPNADLDA